MPVITGTDAADRLVGTRPAGTADVIRGGAGDDIIDGLGGLDELYGDAGNDRVIVSTIDRSRSFFDGGDGHDVLDLSVLPSPFLRVRFDQEISRLYVDDFRGAGAYQDLFISRLASVEELVLGGGDDVFAGAGPFTVIRGGDGADTLSGEGLNRQAWNVSLFGDAGNDTLTGHGGNRLFGGSGDDTLSISYANFFRPDDMVLADGGTGTDRLALNFQIADVTLRVSGGATWLDARVQTNYGGGPGPVSVQFHAVERFSFTDREVVVDDGSPLIDDLFYLLGNRDVARATTIDADDHYSVWGWREGRDPNAWFDTTAYLAANPDVARANINPLEHYRSNGAGEGRDPSPFFDSEQYLARNADVRAAGLNPLEHYLAFGLAEGRERYLAVGSEIRGGFDAQWYRLTYEDVARAGVDPLLHYQTFGAAEGRNPNAYFDSAYYLAQNPAARASGLTPLDHYMQVGWRQGFDPSDRFDTRYYLDRNPDVALAGVNPLEHFLINGRLEGRLPDSPPSFIAVDPLESVVLEDSKTHAGMSIEGATAMGDPFPEFNSATTMPFWLTTMIDDHLY